MWWKICVQIPALGSPPICQYTDPLLCSDIRTKPLLNTDLHGVPNCSQLLSHPSDYLPGRFPGRCNNLNYQVQVPRTYAPHPCH